MDNYERGGMNCLVFYENALLIVWKNKNLYICSLKSYCYYVFLREFVIYTDRSGHKSGHVESMAFMIKI